MSCRVEPGPWMTIGGYNRRVWWNWPGCSLKPSRCGLRTRLAGLLPLLAFLATSASAQINPQSGILEQSGWDALAAGDTRSAAEAFERALEIDPKNARLQLGAGAAAYREGRYAHATLALEQALRLDPGLSAARALLGRARYGNGDLFGAIRIFETVVTQDPDDRGSAETLERWRREAELHDGMQQSLNERFTVSYEGPWEASLATQVLASLDRAYWRIGQMLSTFPTRPISVVLYTTQQFRDITRSPNWAAGAYDGTAIRVPVRGALENPTELDRVFAHEFAHALIRNIAPSGVPTWLNEGLATALEADDIGWASERVRRAGQPLSLEALSSSFGLLTEAEAQLAYATSALAARRLLDEAGGVALANLLRDLDEGLDLAEAFSHRVHRPLTAFLADVP